MRERLVSERTALINQMRALLLERGIVLPQRWRSLAAWVDAPVGEHPLHARREHGFVDVLSLLQQVQANPGDYGFNRQLLQTAASQASCTSAWPN